MASFSLNISACHSCDYRAPKAGEPIPDGVVWCAHDGAAMPIRDRAAEGSCPIGRHDGKPHPPALPDPPPHNADQQVIEPLPEPLPRDRWPLAARVVATLAQDGDRGVGDTLSRIIGRGGGRIYKRWYGKLMGKSCGCFDRQARLNARFPYG